MSVVPLTESNIRLRFSKLFVFWPLIPPQLIVLNLSVEIPSFFTPGHLRVAVVWSLTWWDRRT